jgi:hypothetical protein
MTITLGLRISGIVAYFAFAVAMLAIPLRPWRWIKQAHDWLALAGIMATAVHIAYLIVSPFITRLGLGAPFGVLATIVLLVVYATSQMMRHQLIKPKAWW